MSGDPPANDEIVVVLRRATPTLADGMAFAQLVDTASDGLYRTMIGPARDRVIAAAFKRPGHDLSYEHVVFAEHGDRVVGMAAAYSGAHLSQFSTRPFRRAAGWRWPRVLAVAAVASPVLRFIDTVPDDDFYLMAIAIDHDMRGRGLGSALLDDTQCRAELAGCRRMVLDVVETNTLARRLYERRGMIATETSPGVPLLPGNRVTRMVLDLA